ncbi:MAG: bifunctional folylpolyglutamate synthase/dihydrofolate synthase [Bacteroidia bacterium]|nr:bifunctional folylpolyglutamate synthase/dihydrofolate synthase [Bacteroidia bacterium]
MTYNEALKFLYSRLPMFQRTGPPAYKPGLGNILELMRILGMPHEGGQYIHVAGTNGKGSTSHMLASILMESGYKTGLFTSPHLVDFRERIKVNGKMIPRSAVAQFVEKYRKEVESINPSFFEWTTALAFWWFKKQNCDISVIEVGMGGRLDSTNIIVPKISVITSISFDHKEFLGDTLPKIAAEKAGIIKKNVPVVVSIRQKEVYKVFEEKAKKEHAPIFFADREFKVQKLVPFKNKNIAFIKNKNKTLKFLVGLGGQYQKKNIPGVLKTTELLSEMEYGINEKTIKKGLERITENTGLMGRWQVVKKSPLTILDTGHNEDGIRQVVRQARSLRKKKVYFIFGVVKEKDMEAIFRHLPKSWVYLLVRPEVERGRDALELATEFVKNGYQTVVCSDIQMAFKTAMKLSSRQDLILVGGSTFVVGDFLRKVN